MLVLSGILVMVIGLMLRFNALLVVVAAGFVTGLAGGLSINDIVGAIGEAFVKNRYMSLFILILPVIGLMERHGLRERAEIESKLGTELQWNRGDDIKSSKVFIQLDNVSIENEDDWPQMAKFHADWTKKFYDVIVPYIKG